MSLIFDEEQQMLADSARGFLADKAPVDQIRKLRDAGQGYDPEVWQEMVDLGWPAIHILEEYGGLGYGYRGLGILLEESGRTLSASPLISSVLAASTLIAKAGTDEQRAALLPALAAGTCQMTLAMDEGHHHNPANVKMMAVRDGDHYALNGTKTVVMDADLSHSLLVVARDEDGAWALLVVDTKSEGLTQERQALIDERSYARVTFENVEVAATNRLGEAKTSAAALQYTLDIINIGLAAELYGIARACFEQTVDYLKERRQFDVSIGSFQALQHRAAHMLTELEVAESAVRTALLAADQEEDNTRLSITASAAKIKLSKVAHLVTTEAVQMHGGMGMTDELDIGFYLKRGRVAQQLFGDRQFHLDRYASLKGY